MVTAPIMAAINIATLGQSAAATSATKAAQVAKTVGTLQKAFNKVKSAITAAKGSLETLVGGAEKLKKIQKIVKVGKKTYKVASTVGKEIDLFSRDFADNFADMTSPEIDREINQRFGKEAAYQIKREWAMRQLSMNLEANGFATAKNVLALASVADPTGLISVANAFMHPICKGDAKFPTVTPLYNY
jgi:phage shock protein A